MLIDSAPPATIVVAPPLITRSAAYAMAWSPDAQKRFTVTADAVTGTPARRLAIRATFNPCSASGIAQPMITSSTSPGSMPGARRSASVMTAAASSSGRVPWSVPFGALPTAVRTAETITASGIPVSKEVLDGVADLEDFPVEQMIGGVNNGELFRIVSFCVELLHVLQRAELVAFALYEELGLVARPRLLEIET